MTALPTEPEREVARHGDLLYFVDTGEVCGVARPHGWQPRTLDDCEFVLSLLYREQVEAEALRRRIANLQSMVDRHERTAGFLRGRYSETMAEVVAEHLDGKRRSLDTEFGRVGFRRSRGRTVVTDKELAVVWLEDRYPAAVRREVSVLVSEIPAGVAVPGVEREEPTDRFYLDVSKP